MPLTGILHVHSASILPAETIVKAALLKKPDGLYLNEKTMALSLF
jgi:hypothetical protein